MPQEERKRPDYYRFMLETIPRCQDFNALLKAVHEAFGFPVILVDISYHLVGYGGPEPCPDPYWKAIIDRGVASPETITRHYYEEGYMDRLSSETGPFTVDWGVSKDMLQTTCGVRVDGVLEGIVSVLFLDRAYEQDALMLNAALSTAVEILFKSRADLHLSSAAPERAFTARILLEDTSAPVHLLENVNFYKNAGIRPGYVIFSVALRAPVSGRLQSLRSSIKTAIPSLIYFNKKAHVLFFFKGIQSENDVRHLMDAFRRESKGKVDYVCGVSQIFTDLDNRAAYVEQAELSMEYGMRDQSGKHNHYLFVKLYAKIVCSVGYRNLHPQNLLLPELRLLLEADRENDTNFFESFKCYLYTKCDMSKTAANLFLHRNSLMYRIKRCQEIMNVDVSNTADFERLYICCMVYDILHSHEGGFDDALPGEGDAE